MKRLLKAYGRFARMIGSTSWEEGLDGHARSPAGMTLKNRLRELLGKPGGKA
jgi:hypothetical protein